MSIGGPHEVLPPHGAGAYRTVNFLLRGEVIDSAEERAAPNASGDGPSFRQDLYLLQHCLRRLFLLVRWVTVLAQNTADQDAEVGLDVLAKRPIESRRSLIRTSPNR